MSKAFAVAGFVFLLLGLAVAAGGRALRSYRKSKAQLAGHTTGKVIDLVLREAPFRNGSTFRNLYFPVIEFYANGKLYKENYPYGAYPSAFAVGDSISIDYEPGDPHEYEIRKETIYDYLPTFLYAGGIILAVAGALMFVMFIARR